MILLLDTDVLLWAAGKPERLTVSARSLLEDPTNELLFSAASFWEITIKLDLGRDDFQVDPHLLRRGLLDNGYRELPVTASHVLAMRHLPPLHRDPFDRMLLAQAQTEGAVLVTADATVARYPGSIVKV